MSAITHRCSPDGECFCVYDPECNPAVVKLATMPAAELTALKARADDLAGAVQVIGEENGALRRLLSEALDGLEYDSEQQRRRVWERVTDALDTPYASTRLAEEREEG